MKIASVGLVALTSGEADDVVHYRKSEDKFRTIVGEAGKVLRRNGFGGITLRKVANEAEISLGTLQHYFPTRELLLRTLILQTFEEYNENYELIARSGGSAERRLDAIIRQTLTEIQDEYQRAFLIEVTALAYHHGYAAEALKRSHQAYLSTLSRLVNELSPSLNVRECDLRALLIASQIEGLMTFYQNDLNDTFLNADELRQAVVLVAQSLSIAA